MEVDLASETHLDSVKADPLPVNNDPSPQDQLKAQFDMYDLEHSGSLDLASFLASLQSLRIPKLSNEDIELLFSQYSIDDRIDTENFLSLYERYPYDPNHPHHFFASLIQPEESVTILFYVAKCFISI